MAILLSLIARVSWNLTCSTMLPKFLNALDWSPLLYVLSWNSDLRGLSVSQPACLPASILYEIEFTENAGFWATMDDVPSPQNDLEVQKYGAYDLHMIHLHRYLNAHFKQEINKYKSAGNSVQSINHHYSTTSMFQ